MDDLKKVIEHLRGLLEMVRGHPNLTMVGYFLAMALVEAEEEFARQGFRTRNPPPPPSNDYERLVPFLNIEICLRSAWTARAICRYLPERHGCYHAACTRQILTL